MANREVAVPDEFFVRLREMTAIGQSERVDLIDAGGRGFLSIELGVLGRDEEITDQNGVLVGKMQDRMHIEGIKGYRSRNLLDGKGKLIGRAMPKVPDPKPGERHYFLNDENNSTIALAVTTQEIYPVDVEIRSGDGSSVLSRMNRNFDQKSTMAGLDKTPIYKISINSNQVPRLLMHEFIVSLFLFVLKA